MIVCLTLLVGQHCSNMMIHRTFEHKHHNLLMISSLLIVNALYPNVALGFPPFSKSKIQDIFQFFPQDFQPISRIRLNNKITTFSLS